MDWLKPRILALGKTGAAFARALSIPKPRVYEMYRGARQLQSSEIAPAAQFLEMTEAELLAKIGGHKYVTSTALDQSVLDQRGLRDGMSHFRERAGGSRFAGDVRDYPGKMQWGPDDFPVYGATNTGGGIMVLSESHQLTSRPEFALTLQQAFSVYAKIEEMQPAINLGDLVFLHPDKPAKPTNDVLLMTEMPGNGATPETALRRLISSTDTHWHCEQFNPPKREKFPKGKWKHCLRVEMVVRG